MQTLEKRIDAQCAMGISERLKLLYYSTRREFEEVRAEVERISVPK